MPQSVSFSHRLHRGVATVVQPSDCNRLQPMCNRLCNWGATVRATMNATGATVPLYRDGARLHGGVLLAVVSRHSRLTGPSRGLRELCGRRAWRMRVTSGKKSGEVVLLVGKYRRSD